MVSSWNQDRDPLRCGQGHAAQGFVAGGTPWVSNRQAGVGLARGWIRRIPPHRGEEAANLPAAQSGRR